MPYPSIFAALCAFIMLILFPDASRQAAASGLSTCAELIIPSLFPFIIVVNLLNELGVIAGITGCFKKNGYRYATFIIGITGGYPAGAAFLASLRKRGDISAEDAAKLLIFCNNSGPAFIIGAVGFGVFSSLKAGIILYVSHFLSAVFYGRLFCKTDSCSKASSAQAAAENFSRAFTASVKNAAASVIGICSFVVAFSVVLGMLNAGGLLSIISGKMSELINTELHFNAALLSGMLEIGSSISCMQGLACSPLSLSLASFILGWGGLSVHFQTLSLISETDIKTARYVIGRFMIAVISAIISFGMASAFRI